MIKTIINTDDDGVIINTKEYKYNIFDPEKGYRFRGKAKFSKIFRLEFTLGEVLKDPSDIGRLHILAENCNDENMVICKKGKKHITADISNIGKMIFLCDRNTKDYIKKMSKAGLMATNKIIINDKKVIEYYITPIYFVPGNFINDKLYNLFKKQLDKVLSSWVIKKYNEGE